MAGSTQAIDLTLSQLHTTVAEGLEGDGWQLRDIGAPSMLACFTRPLGGGFCASFTLLRASFSWPDDFPVPVELRFGAGYEPATALMPVLTLGARFSLVHELTPEENGTTFTLEGPDVATIGRQIVQEVGQHGNGFAEQHQSVDALDAALAEKTGSEWSRHESRKLMMRATFLAAAGRHEAARELIDASPTPPPAERGAAEYLRFERQLRSWLDAGGPPIPPLEQTLRALPPPPPRPKPLSFSDARRRAKEQNAATQRVRDTAHGKSRDELIELLTAEYSKYDFDTRPSSIALEAEKIHRSQQPFGRARSALWSLRMMKALGGAGVEMSRHGTGPDPDWMQPPPEASYPVSTGSRYTAVVLDEHAGAWLERAAAAAGRRIGPMAPVTVWLTEDAGEVVVHLGEQAVGRLTQQAAATFAAELTAAKLFHEQPRVPGHLVVEPGSPPLLEIGLPAA